MKDFSNQNQKGNALFFILIAVVLMGLLTMVLSRSGSNTDQSGDFEQIRVQASQILRYAKSIEAAVQEMSMRNVSENDISFENTLSTTSYTNTNCDAAADRSFPGCLLFNVEGAGLTYLEPNDRWLDSSNSGETFYGDWLFTGKACIPKAGNGTTANCITNASDNDLIMILPYIRQDLCQHINTLVGAPVTSGNPPEDDGDAWDTSEAPFTGAYGGTGAQNIADNPLADIQSNFSGCFEGGGTPASGTYHFYHVLLAR